MPSIKRIFCRALATLDVREVGSRSLINGQCRGYSGASHWRFFRWLVAEHRPRSICILGVYHGRDIAYLGHFLQRDLPKSARPSEDYRIVGVDKFTDTPGEDWPQQARQLSWQQAGYGPPPSMEQTRASLRSLQLGDNVELVAGTAEDFLSTTNLSFDFVYVDISHDYESTVRTLRLARRCLTAQGIIAGDDYSDQGTWGVKRAVREVFPAHRVFDAWIWWATARDYASES